MWQWGLWTCLPEDVGVERFLSGPHFLTPSLRGQPSCWMGRSQTGNSKEYVWELPRQSQESWLKAWATESLGVAPIRVDDWLLKYKNIYNNKYLIRKRVEQDVGSKWPQDHPRTQVPGSLHVLKGGTGWQEGEPRERVWERLRSVEASLESHREAALFLLILQLASAHLHPTPSSFFPFHWSFRKKGKVGTLPGVKEETRQVAQPIFMECWLLSNLRQ